ncbi:hypothetical protein B0I21_102333 [Sphingobacterium paludis]|uniref:Uncharacterized protein n=1 Tax=Sphingobacterium paludis TaxID=1476465 RepID=A0A4R7D733_9SPHI|nr:hypothetical protein B0I21_102333 [Sphingobacterium paludis]
MDLNKAVKLTSLAPVSKFYFLNFFTVLSNNESMFLVRNQLNKLKNCIPTV